MEVERHAKWHTDVWSTSLRRSRSEALRGSGSPVPTLNAWGHQTVFRYEGSVDNGTTIEFGPGAAVVGQQGHHATISAQDYSNLLAHFSGQTVTVGTSRDNPPANSLGEWLMTHVSHVAVASYVAQILVHGGFAERVEGDDLVIRFK
jgi:hypothetical protein